MNELPADLRGYISKPDIVRELAEQLVRDFQMVGLQVDFRENAMSVYEELFGQIFPQIEHLLSTQQQKVISLLYRIDLSEEQVKMALSQQAGRYFPAVLTDLILKRELQKVILRRRFSKG